jgi:hypothetical protein
LVLGVLSSATTNGIANGNVAVSSATAAYILGQGTNSTSNSLLIGNGSFVNIRANAACDLGTTAIPFNGAYLNALRLKQGATGAVLVAGAVTVATTAVSTGDTVLLSRTAIGVTLGHPYISAISNGVSFTITSSSGTDTSTFSWVIIKQA